MKKLFLPVIIVLGAILSSVSLGENETLYGKVTWIYNGDTFKLKTEQSTYKVKLFGIDAPEDGQNYADQSKETLAEMIEGKIVSVSQCSVDSHGRTVGVVSVGSENINQQMLEKGMAWWARNLVPKNDLFSQLEETARTEKRGLWQDAAPIAPWDWKAATKEAKKASQ